MSDIDWKAFDDPKFDPKRIPLFDEPPKRDMAVNDGDTIKLGDTTFKLYVIPGHTLGTLATVFTVHDKGKPHRAVAWGGTAYNFGPLPDRLQIYADTTAKYRDIMKTGKRRRAAVEPCQLRQRGRQDGDAEGAQSRTSPIPSWSAKTRCTASSPCSANARWRPRPMSRRASRGRKARRSDGERRPELVVASGQSDDSTSELSARNRDGGCFASPTRMTASTASAAAASPAN